MNECPYCEGGHLIEKKDFNHKDYVLKATVYNQCDNCGNIFLSDELLTKIEDINRKVSGLLSPSEIKNCRKEIHKKQSDLAIAIGVSIITYKRWENGLFVHNKVQDQRLREYFEQQNQSINKKVFLKTYLDDLLKPSHSKNMPVFAHSDQTINLKTRKAIKKAISK